MRGVGGGEEKELVGGGERELTQRQLISLTFKSRDPNANRGLTRHHGKQMAVLPAGGDIQQGKNRSLINLQV